MVDKAEKERLDTFNNADDVCCITADEDVFCLLIDDKTLKITTRNHPCLGPYLYYEWV